MRAPELLEAYHSVGRALAAGERAVVTATDGDKALDLVVARDSDVIAVRIDDAPLAGH